MVNSSCIDLTNSRLMSSGSVILDWPGSIKQPEYPQVNDSIRRPIHWEFIDDRLCENVVLVVAADFASMSM